MTVERVELDRVRLGGRNFLRVGDLVEVKPSRPKKHDGYVGRARRIYEQDGRVIVEVSGGPIGRPSITRSLYLDRLARTRATAPTARTKERVE